MRVFQLVLPCAGLLVGCGGGSSTPTGSGGRGGSSGSGGSGATAGAAGTAGSSAAGAAGASAAGAAGSGAAGAAGQAGGGGITIATRWVDDTSAPVAGVRVCALSRAAALAACAGGACDEGHALVPCTDSDVAGAAKLGGIPPDSELLLIGMKSGYQNAALSFRVKTWDPQPTDVGIYTITSTADWYVTLGQAPYDPADGELDIFTDAAGGGSLAGVSVEISPSAGTVLYGKSGASLEIDPALVASSDAGWAVVPHLPAGEYTVRYSHPSLTCDAPSPLDMGWSAASADSVVVMALPNTIMRSRKACH